MIEKEELISLLPHRGRMLLISKAIGYNFQERSICAEYHITEDCLFYDPAIGGVPAWVGYELMAQTISVLSGLWDRERGEKPKFGFIMSVSSMRFEIPFFRAGSTLEIKVKEIGCVDMVHTFKGGVSLEGKSVLEGKITVLDANDELLEKLTKGRFSIG